MPTQLRPIDPAPAVWAGLECSHVRIGDRWADQLARTGHHRRDGDLDLIASLGVTAVRYPILWGWSSGMGPHDDGWGWVDRRLQRLRGLGLRPIVGLLHHGGGPLPDGFLDPGFVDGLARHARSVARRHPWVRDYLPINEPVTNARFGGVSGVWHPHATDAATFARLFVRQVLGIRAAIRAIRTVRSDARLIVNDDMGRTFGTPEMSDAVHHMNLRRWLTYDALTGRITRQHPLRGLLAVDDATRRQLDDIAADPEPPDVIGLDHYVVSDRFLDHRIDAYPVDRLGSDDRVTYADVELVRVRPETAAAVGATLDPFARALREAWERYRIPLALAEVQLAGEPADQVAWWRTAWRAAGEAAMAGVDVRGVTAWAALGAYDWSSLLVRDEGHYEPGAFDARWDPPRRTPLGDAVAAAAAGRDRLGNDEIGGWWTRRERALWPTTGAAAHLR